LCTAPIRISSAAWQRFRLPTTYLGRKIGSSICNAVGQVDEYECSKHEVDWSPFGSWYNQENAFRVSGEPKVILNDESLERAFSDESKRARVAGAEYNRRIP